MGRTSIKNKFILCFLVLILIVMVVVTAVNLVTEQFYLAQAVSTAIALGVGIFFGSLFSNSLVWRLNNLSSEAEKISNGDLTREIQVTSVDEIRSLEEIFRAMVSQIRSMILDIKTVALKIDEANVTLVELTRKLIESSREIDRSAQAIAKGSGVQTAIVQKTSLQVENGVKSMDNLINQSARTMAKITTVMEKTQSGENNARDTLNRLEDVLREMGVHAEPITRLANKVEKIKLIISVMDGIAQKTDLLSLNASIEASRAGESGKGFALVADEIRSMADSSKQSSREITRLVEDILQDNKTVRGLLTKNQADINKGHDIIHGIVETFGQMATGVREIYAEVNQMETVTAQQVDQMRGMAEAFQELSRLATRNFTATQKTTVATANQKRDVSRIVRGINNLKSLSRQMMETQQRFKLPERIV